MAVRATNRTIAIAAVAAVAAAGGFAVLATSKGADDGPAPSAAPTAVGSEAVDTDAMVAAFDPGQPLGEVRLVAGILGGAEVGGQGVPGAACQEAAGRLDLVGTPDELAAAAIEVGDSPLSEAALEQQAAVSSVLAACRGEAPISVTEAISELAVSNSALEGLLAELSGSDADDEDGG